MGGHGGAITFRHESRSRRVRGGWARVKGEGRMATEENKELVRRFYISWFYRDQTSTATE